jgi:hypothetical protein
MKKELTAIERQIAQLPSERARAAYLEEQRQSAVARHNQRMRIIAEE